jgi:hypothetical protein
MNQKMTWEIPIRTVSELNCTENWRKKHKRHKQQQYFVKLALKQEICQVSLPCQIKITRLSPRELDYGNLVSSQKWVEDAVCDSLIPGLQPGRADGDKRITTSFHQEKRALAGVRIEIIYEDT